MKCRLAERCLETMAEMAKWGPPISELLTPPISSDDLPQNGERGKGIPLKTDFTSTAPAFRSGTRDIYSGR